MMPQEIIPRQLFETEVGVHGASLTARFLVVPSRSVDDPGLLIQPKDLLERLELQLVKPLPVETDLPPSSPGSRVKRPARSTATELTHRIIHLGLAAVLEQPTATDAAALMERLMEASPAELRWLVSSDVLDFAGQMTNEPMVPFEMSPFGLESLLGVVAKGSGPGIGAAVAIVASGPTPLLLITVPAGMIIGGAAFGVGQALQLGLRNRLLRLMGVQPSEADRAE